MADIKTVAGHTMDLYFGDFAEAAEFFDIDDFVFYTGAAYADLLGQEYRIEYAKMAAEGEGNLVSFSHDWLQTFEAKRDKDDDGYFIKLPQPVMSFPFDKRDLGIQNIFAANKLMAKEYIRSSIGTIWQDQFLPASTNIYWALLRDKIYLYTNIGEPPMLSKLVYIPGISDDLDIPDTRVQMVMTDTLKMMRDAEQGNLVKETADGNLNETLVSDVDRNLIKA